MPVNSPSLFGLSISVLNKDNDMKNKEFKALLIIKIKNSQALFAFPMLILIGNDSISGSGFS